MKQRQNIGTLLLVMVILLMGNIAITVAQVTFKATAPASVVQGEQFRLSYVLNKEGQDLRLPDMPDFDILFGPSTSTSYSQRTVNGKTTTESSVTYTYILMAKKTGTFTIPAATITVDGSTYQSNTLRIKVLPPDEPSAQGTPPGGQQRKGSASTGTATVSDRDAFIRAIVSKNNVYEQEGFSVTFRLYTTLNIVNFGKFNFLNLRDSWWRIWSSRRISNYKWNDIREETITRQTCERHCSSRNDRDRSPSLPVILKWFFGTFGQECSHLFWLPGSDGRREEESGDKSAGN